MRIRLFHYDMTDRDLALGLSLFPGMAAVEAAWKAGKYTQVDEIDGRMSDTEEGPMGGALDDVYCRTQSTGRYRSTSVGDVMVLQEDEGVYRAWVVDNIGFYPIFLPVV